jgi:lysozyme
MTDKCDLLSVSADWTPGIDCSIWQDDNNTPQMMDFAKAYQAGARFVFIKASQGPRIDGDFMLNAKSAARSPLKIGYYHFIDWFTGPAAQARLFLTVIKGEARHLPAVLDFEKRSGCPGKKKASSALLYMVKAIQDGLGENPMIYTSPSFWTEFGSTSHDFARLPLWLAHYISYRWMEVPWPWATADAGGVDFWQYTSKGPGPQYGSESKSIDLNWCLKPQKYGLATKPAQQPMPAVTIP